VSLAPTTGACGAGFSPSIATTFFGLMLTGNARVTNRYSAGADAGATKVLYPGCGWLGRRRLNRKAIAIGANRIATCIAAKRARDHLLT